MLNKNAMNYSGERLRSGLEERFGCTLAQQILSEIEAANQPEEEIDTFDVRALGQLADQYRVEARHAVKQLKQWRKGRVFDGIVGEAQRKEGDHLRDRAVAAVRFYRDANKNFIRLYHAAMKQMERKMAMESRV